MCLPTRVLEWDSAVVVLTLIPMVALLNRMVAWAAAMVLILFALSSLVRFLLLRLTLLLRLPLLHGPTLLLRPILLLRLTLLHGPTLLLTLNMLHRPILLLRQRLLRPSMGRPLRLQDYSLPRLVAIILGLDLALLLWRARITVVRVSPLVSRKWRRLGY